MDKNTITGFILIGLVIWGFTWFSRPSESELRQLAIQDSIAAVEQQKAEATLEQEAQQMQHIEFADSNTLFYNQLQGEAKEVTLKNNLVKITLNTQGAQIQEAEIIGYKSRHGGDVKLMGQGNSAMSFDFAGKNANIKSGNYHFTPTAQTDSSVTMMLLDGNKALAIEYCLQPNSYMVDIAIRAQGLSGFFAPSTNTLDISWTDRIIQQEKGYDFENQNSSLTYMEKGEGSDNLSETGNDNETPEHPLSWVAFKNQFFSAVLLAPKDFTATQLSSMQEEKSSGYLKTYNATAKTFFDPTGNQPTELQMYLGPNDFHTLQDHNALSKTQENAELEELVYLGWPLFRWINRWFILYLFDWLTALGLPMGYVLLLLTIIVKALVYPSTKKSYMSSAKMRVLKPQIDALNAKYPKQEDAMKKQQEMMQIYSQYGVSPMGGCLPMLLQTPIWIALFNFVPNAIELRGQSFLWADDLSAYDDILRWNTDLWLIGDHLSIFCLLFCATNIINTWISMRQQQNQLSGEQAQQMKMMQYMMYFMPIMFFFMFNNYSSGLCYYYFLSGLTSILIMWYLRKTTDDKKLLAKLEEYRAKHKNDPKKMSGMAARLEALQKQAQMMEEQRQKNKR